MTNLVEDRDGRAYRVGYFVNATEGVYDVMRAQLEPLCRLVTLPPGGNPVDAVQDLDFLIALKAPAALIDAAPRLRLLMSPGIGYDGIDLQAATRRNISVACTICGNVDEVAEHTMLLMLSLSRRLVELDRSMREGRWLMWERRLQCFNLAGRTLGLIGFGRIGQEVASRALAFKMNVQYFDPAHPEGERYRPLEQLLATSDIVSLHVPLTGHTRGLLNAERIALMKPGAVLLNTARGEVVDEAAVIAALQSGHLGAAGLDVFSPEPPAKDNPLLSMPNVVLTPHVGSGTADGLRVKAVQYRENIRRYLAGEPLLDSVMDNPDGRGVPARPGQERA